MSAITVLIVDDDDLMREGLGSVLASDPALRVVAKAASGRQAVEHARRTRPDVILMDVRMPDLDGIAATQQITAADPDARVAILTTFEEDDYIFRALRAGASAFLLKRTSPEELIAAIHTIAGGESLLSPSVTTRVVRTLAAQKEPDDALRAQIDALTAREREVLELIARGRSNREIGRELVIQESTVKSHVKRTLSKLGARNRVHAVILAYEGGLVD